MFSFLLSGAGYCKCKADGKQFQEWQGHSAANWGFEPACCFLFRKNI
jgi:hypothetical protein